MITSFPAPRKLTSRESSIAPVASTSNLRASTSTSSLESKHDTSRVNSVLRLQACWQDIEERHQSTSNQKQSSRGKSRALREDEDDIIDLSTMEIVVDRGVLRGSRAGSYAIGSFALPGIGLAYTGEEDMADSDESDLDEEEWEKTEEDDIGGWDSNLDLPSVESRLDRSKRGEVRDDLRRFLMEEVVRRNEGGMEIIDSNSGLTDDISTTIEQLESDPGNTILSQPENPPSRSRTRTPGSPFPLLEGEADDSSSEEDEMAIKSVPSPSILSSPGHRLHRTSPLKSSRKIITEPPDSTRSLRFEMQNTKLSSVPPKAIPRPDLSTGRRISLSVSSPSNSRRTSLASSYASSPMTSSPLRRTSFPRSPSDASSSRSSPLVNSIGASGNKSSGSTSSAIKKKKSRLSLESDKSNIYQGTNRPTKTKQIPIYLDKPTKTKRSKKPSKKSRASSVFRTRARDEESSTDEESKAVYVANPLGTRTSPRLNGVTPVDPLEAELAVTRTIVRVAKPKPRIDTRIGPPEAVSNDIFDQPESLRPVENVPDVPAVCPPSASTCSPPNSFRYPSAPVHSNKKVDSPIEKSSLEAGGSIKRVLDWQVDELAISPVAPTINSIKKRSKSVSSPFKKFKRASTATLYSPSQTSTRAMEKSSPDARKLFEESDDEDEMMIITPYYPPPVTEKESEKELAVERSWRAKSVKMETEILEKNEVGEEDDSDDELMMS